MIVISERVSLYDIVRDNQLDNVQINSWTAYKDRAFGVEEKNTLKALKPVFLFIFVVIRTENNS